MMCFRVSGKLSFSSISIRQLSSRVLFRDFEAIMCGETLVNFLNYSQHVHVLNTGPFLTTVFLSHC